MKVYCVEFYDAKCEKYVRHYFSNVSIMADYIIINELKDVEISTIVVDPDC